MGGDQLPVATLSAIFKFGEKDIAYKDMSFNELLRAIKEKGIPPGYVELLTEDGTDWRRGEIARSVDGASLFVENFKDLENDRTERYAGEPGFAVLLDEVFRRAEAARSMIDERTRR